MKIRLLQSLAALGALFFLATPAANAQNAYSNNGLDPGGRLGSGQSRSWAYEVPAGNYVVIARVSYTLSSGIDGSGISCQLKYNGSTEFLDLGEASISSESYSSGEITLMSQAAFQTPGGIAVECRGVDRVTGNQTVRNVVVELIQVNALHTMRPIDTSGPAMPRDQMQQNQQRREPRRN